VGRGDTPGDTPTDALLSEMRDRIADPRDQLAAERRANEENPRIIAALTARIPATEAPRESPSAATEQPGRERAAGAGRRPAASRRAPVLVAEHVWGVRWSVAAALVAIAAVLLGVLVA
jgi:Flp pilus assembly protein TadB